MKIVFALCYITLLVCIPVSPSMDISRQLEPPSRAHLCGFDVLGRDQLGRIASGARISLAVGLLATLCALCFGTFFGACAGLGYGDQLFCILADLFYLIPASLTAMVMMLFFHHLSFIFALVLTAWVMPGRLIRAKVMALRSQLFIENARALGQTPQGIVMYHMLPHLWPLCMQALLLQVPSTMMAESVLSFLGLGIASPHASFGSLVQEGFRVMHAAPHALIFPALALFLCQVSIMSLGQALKSRTHRF